MLLGWYLGDGHIVLAKRGLYVLSISNDPKYSVLNQGRKHLRKIELADWQLEIVAK